MKLADIHVTPNYCNTLGLFFEVQVLLRISFMAVNYLTNPFLSYILKLKKKTIVYNSCTSQTVNVSEDLSCASILIHQTVHSDIATNRYTSATVNILIYIYTLPCQYSSEATVIFCIHCHVNAKSSNKIKGQSGTTYFCHTVMINSPGSRKTDKFDIFLTILKIWLILFLCGDT